MTTRPVLDSQLPWYSVRLFAKPSEKCVKDTRFPQHKFHELLMWLSYSGVMPKQFVVEGNASSIVLNE